MFLSCSLQVLQKPSVEARQQLTVLSRSVAGSVSEIVHAAEAIKGTYPYIFIIYLSSNIDTFFLLCYTMVLFINYFI